MKLSTEMTNLKLKTSHNFIDLTKQRFGRLIVICKVPKVGKEKPRWKCRCDCGTVVVVWGGLLRKGNTRSCGCYQLEQTRSANTKHGKHGSKSYSSWSAMMDRCLNSRSKDYPGYGAIGISVCKRWTKFKNFYEDMGDPPENHTIDRKNGSLGYFKGNCRWATSKEQARNRSSNVVITHNNRSMCLSEWAEELGFSRFLLTKRLRRGWSIERALETPTLTKFSNQRPE